MKLMKSFIRLVVWKFWLIIAWKRSRKLKKDQDELVSKFASLVYDTINNKVKIEDKLWIDNIESLRKELKLDKTELIITDHGAGTPKALRSEAEMHTGKVISTTVSAMNTSSKSPFWALLLFKIIYEFKPKTALELGTNLGISAAYQAAALTVYTSGKLITLEGSSSLVERSRNHFTNLGLLNIETVQGRFSDTLAKALKEHHPIDYVFIDGHHNQNALITYFNTILPYLSDNSIIVFDDITWSKGMKLAWKTITNNPNIKFVFNLNKLGVCFLDKEGKDQQRIVNF